MFPSDTNFDTKVTLETDSTPSVEKPPFHILFLGDWSGRENRRANSDSLNLRPIEIDRDNFDDIMRKLRVRLDLDFQGNGENTLSLEFNELDDFHPDGIFQRLPLFADLRDVRRRLTNKNTFNEAAKEVRSWMVDSENQPSDEVEKQSAVKKTSVEPPDDLLDQILNQTDDVSAPRMQNTEDSGLSALVAKLVKTHLIETDTEEQSKLLIIVDEVISDLMRRILHHPQFQALEAAWRGVYLLVRRIETSVNLKLFLLDIDKAELISNLKSFSDLSDSDMYRVLIEETVEPWAVIGGNYTFGLNVDDVAVLMRLAKLGNVANAPFISYILPEMFGFSSFESIMSSDSWQISEDSTENKLWFALRSLPEANYLGLALPRFLTRLPYGEKTEPTEAFYFEESTLSIKHEEYVWANPSFICILLLAQSFQSYGWDIKQNFLQDVSGLPSHLYQDDEEVKTKPCTEIVMTQSNCEKLINQGLITLISFRNDDKIRLGRFQSIAQPFSVLQGKWIDF